CVGLVRLRPLKTPQWRVFDELSINADEVRTNAALILLRCYQPNLIVDPRRTHVFRGYAGDGNARFVELGHQLLKPFLALLNVLGGDPGPDGWQYLGEPLTK